MKILWLPRVPAGCPGKLMGLITGPSGDGGGLSPNGYKGLLFLLYVRENQPPYLQRPGGWW